MPSPELAPLQVTPAEIVGRGSAMACAVSVRLAPGDHEPSGARAAVRGALQVFTDVQDSCTRFDSSSDLMRANAAPEVWTAVAPYCFDALAEAYAAYRRTDGRFDPRVLDDLVRLGYDRSMTLGPPSSRPASALQARAPLPPWRPEFRRATREVRLGRLPVDLGGIGKGLSVRWAADRLHGVGLGCLVEAGGDCLAAGVAPDGGPWRVAVEDPAGGAEPLAVLALSNRAVATSSVRIRSWRVAGVPVHHLIDPATGRPGGDGLTAVTVVDGDPATAEVWSKTLFLTGAAGVATTAAHFGLAALWVTTRGEVRWSPPLQPHLLWTAPHLPVGVSAAAAG